MHANEQLPLLLDGTLDLSIIRDAEPTEGLSLRTLSRESYVAVLPEHHKLAARKTLRPEMLKNERIVLFSPRIARLAYERTVEMFLAHGFRPNVVQEAPNGRRL
jgi:DNA-binding transcriptional LysR family regulator